MSYTLIVLKKSGYVHKFAIKSQLLKLDRTTQPYIELFVSCFFVAN